MAVSSPSPLFTSRSKEIKLPLNDVEKGGLPFLELLERKYVRKGAPRPPSPLINDVTDDIHP
jgi:hypothetical protein